MKMHIEDQIEALRVTVNEVNDLVISLEEEQRMQAAMIYALVVAVPAAFLVLAFLGMFGHDDVR